MKIRIVVAGYLTKLLRLLLLCVGLGALGDSSLRAGLNLEMNVIRYDQYGFYFSPNLTTNATPPNIAFGDYAVVSSGYPGTGSGGLYRFDTNGFNSVSGTSWGYGDFATMLTQLTNGNWSIYYTNATTTNLYTFTVTANIDSNSLPPVTITYPANGAINVSAQPTYAWRGPTNYSDLVVYAPNGSDTLAVTATNWPSPRSLYLGINDFSVHYDSNSLTAVVSSVPLDAGSNALSGWSSSCHFQDYLTSQFSVGTVDTTGTSHALVAHYTWDGTNTDGSPAGTDTSGNGYDLDYHGSFGTQGGVNSTTDGENGSRAIQFHNSDGNSGGYLGWNATPAGLLTTLSGNFSVSCWIKTTQSYGWDQNLAFYGVGIVTADNNGLANDVIPMALTGNKLGFNTGGDTEDVTLNSVASINDGNYHHVVVTRNQSTGQKIIYIDGELDSFSSGTLNALSDPQKITIGALADAWNPAVNDGSYANGFDGELDDLQIYSGVLAAIEVASLYANPGSTVANGGGTVVTGGHAIVARYDFEQTNAPGVDSSGHGNDSNCSGGNGTVADTNSIDAAVGSYSRQFFGDTFVCFAPGANSYNQLSNTFAGDFTVSAWVKSTASAGYPNDSAFNGAAILFAYNANTNSTVPLAITDGKVTITVFNRDGNSATAYSQTSVNDGQYHQIAVSRNQSSGILKVYVDGQLEGSAAGTVDPLFATSTIYLGGSWVNDYTGLLDDVQIYSGVLSDGEVASLHTSPGTVVPDRAGAQPGPVAHYDFNGGTVLATDVSGNGNNIINAGNFGGSEPVISLNAKAGSGAVQFDGGSYLTANSNLLTTLAGDFTVSLWLKTGQSVSSPGAMAWQGAGVLCADSPNAGAKDVIPVALTGGQVAFNVGNGSSDDTLNSSTTVNDNSWHHVVVTRNQATGDRQIYIDGALDASGGGTTALLNDPELLTIGAKADASNPDPASPDSTGSNGYDGLLDDLQIYNRVLSSDEVTFLYHNPGQVVGGSVFGAALEAPALSWTTGGDLPWFVETTNTYDGVSAAQSGAITDGQASWLQTTIPSDGELSFHWQVSSESGQDYLTFYINGVQQTAISGAQTWNQATYAVHSGDTLRWEYTKDPDCCADGLDAGFLDQITYVPSGSSSSQDFNLALGTQNLNWTTTGDAHWFTEGTNTHDGYFAARSGSITNGQTSTLQTTITGPCTLNFWWTSLSYYDGFYLAFGLDGSSDSLYGGYFGNWSQTANVTIPPGNHTVAWTAVGGDDPTDAAFLDQVSISPNFPPLIYSGPVDGTVTGAVYNFTVPVKLGSNTVLAVQLAGLPAPDIRWYANGTLLTNATNATLVITNTQFANRGYYQLQASNYLGTVWSSSVFLKVYQDTDLQPLSISVPPVVSSSAIVPVVWTVTNTGPAAISNYYDTINFSVPVVTPDFSQGSLWSTYVNFPVLSATTYSITNTTHRFANIPAGNYTLVLNVDSGNDIIETNENNNWLTNVPITVINPDMQPGNFQIVTVTNLGNSVVQFTYNITNNGPGILDGANFYDEIFLSTNTTLDSSAQGIKQINEAPTIGVGGYVSVTNTLTIPIVPSGSYYLILHVDHYGFQDIGNIWETNETNNYAVVPIHIQQSDLVPTNLNIPALVSSREPLAASWGIYNQGDGLATNLSYVGLFDDVYLSTNTVIDSHAIKLGNYYYYNFNGYQYYGSQDFYWNAGVAPGQTFTNRQNLIIPNIPAGNYYLLLAVDVQNAIHEINEANNLLVQPVTLGTLDLQPTAFTVPAAANTRAAIPVTWAVTNQGTGTVYPEWVDRVFISTNAFYDRTATLLGEFTQTNALAAASSYAVSNTIALNGVGAGNYYLLLYVDAATNVLDINRTNNVLAMPLNISSPDLVATTLNVVSSLSSQQPFSAVYSVTNESAITAYSGWSDRLYLSPDGLLGTNDITLIFGYDYYSGQPETDVFHGGDLPGGAGYAQLVSGSIPAVPAGDYFMLLQANANNFFAENNLQNNLLAKPVHVNNPDLVLTNFAAPSTIVVTQYSQSFEADWSVLNQGAGGAYVGWWDYLYLSRTNVLDTNAVAITANSKNPVLDSGEPYLAFARATLPDGIQGNYYLLLRVNDSQSLFESTYTNNLVVHPLNVVVPPVPVLSVVTVDSPADAWSGQQIYVTWTLTNSGPAAVSGTFNDLVYFCNSSTGTGAQVYGQFQFTGQIPPGQSIVRQQKISLPISLQGTFWVAVQTDPNHSIFEFTYRTNDFLVASHPLQVHLTPTPNLVINRVTAPTNMYSGGEGTVSWVETNSGAGPTSAFYWDDAVYLCDTTNFYTANYRILLAAPNNVAYLNPGDSYLGTADIGLPRGISGTFYFIVWADSGNNVFEGTNKNDNLLTSAPVFVQPAPTPDLQTTTVQPPHDAFSGQSVTVTYAVTNFGLGQTQPTEVQWRDRVYISTNTILDSTATYLGDVVHNGGLIPQAGYSATTTQTLPVGISGDWYFIVQADIYNQVYEAAFEDNNSRAAAYVTHIALTPPPDLEVAILHSPTNLAAAHTLNVTYEVDNSGTTITPNSGWTDNLYVWTNAVFDPNHAIYLGGAQHYGALTPGAGYTNTFAISLPVELTGTYYMFVQTDVGNVVFELNKTNNLTGTTNPVVIALQPSDLVATSLTAPTLCNAGSGILVSWAVTNRGVGDTAISVWNDQVILSQNILPGAPSDVLLAQITHFGVVGTNAGYAVSNQVVQVPTSVPAGNYQLFLIADGGGSVPVETNRANNVYGPVPITITAHSPDLQIVTASAPTNALSGSTVLVSWKETNAGDLPANATYWYDTVYLSPDGLIGPDAVYLGSAPSPSPLPPGQTYSNTLAVTLPVNVQSNYYFVVVADGFNYIPEVGGLENNNAYVITPPVFITLAAVPDIAVTSVVTPTNAFAGQSFHLSWVVKNVGTTNATGGWYDVAYLSVDQILDPTVDTYLGYAYQTHDLAVGASYTNTADFQIPQGLSGPFYVFVNTDPGHSLNERGQLTNNTAYNPQAMLVQLLPPVDLVAGQVTIPVNAIPGQNMTVSYSVQNQGSNTAVGSWQDSLFISADTNWDIGDKLFAKVTHTGDVLPGGGYTNTVTAALPGVVPGDYHLIVRSDILNHLAESDKSNNVAASLHSAAIEVPTLTFDQLASDSLMTGQSAFYQFAATNGQTIHLQFTSTASFADNEVFVKYGNMPDSGNFDVAANAPFTANPEVYLAVTNTGTYYVLVKCNYAPTPAPYTLLAEVLPFVVREVQPNLSANVGQTTFFIRGALFDDGTQFALQQADRTINAQAVYLADSTAAYVTFNMNAAPDGSWDFVATMTNASGTSISTTLTNAVTVGTADPVTPDVSIDGPLAVREPSLGYTIHSCLVDYGNSGYSDLPPPLILVQSEESTTLGTTLHSLQTKTIELLGRSLVGPPDILRSQSQASKLLYYRGGGTHIEVWTLTADSTRTMTEADWQDVENSVRPAGLADADWLNFWVNIRPRLGSTWGDYVQFLDRVATNFPAEQREVSAMFLSLYTNSPGFHASALLTGRLLGANDGLPQSNVELDLMTVDTNTDSGTVVARAQTDIAGNFTFPYLAPGQYYYSVDGSFFDMNRDNQADTDLVGCLMTSTDLVNQVVYLYQGPTNSPTLVTNEDTPTLAMDGDHVLHSFWYRNGALWHAWNNNGNWIDAGAVTTNAVGAYAVGVGPNPSGGTNADLIAAWSQITSNNVELFYAVGRPAASGGFEWSQSVMLTTDDLAQNTSPAIAVQANGLAVITYLKRASRAQDDTDVYYSVVNLASGDLVWSGSAAQAALLVAPQDTSGGYDVKTGKISINTDKSWTYDLGSEVIAFKAAFTANGGKSGCTAAATGTATVGVTTTSAQDAVNLNGSVTGNFAWQINPEQCDWEFKSATIDINGGVHYDMKNAATRILRAIPHPAPKFIAQGLDEMQDFLRRWVTIDNTVGFGAGIGLNGFGWTHPPAPVDNWREPDVYGRDVVTLDANITLGVSTRGSKQIVVSSIEPVEFSFWHPNEIKQFNHLEGTNSPGVSLGLSGMGKIQAVFEIYPSFHLRSVTPSGEFKVSLAPYYSFTYPLTGSLIADHGVNSPAAQVQPRSGPASDTLPAGWNFSFDPTPFIGDTNVFGTNSVLSNVQSDLYQDDPPVLAIDTNGVTFQVWNKFGNPYATHPGGQVYVADFNGSTWNAPQILPGSLGLNSDICALTDSQGHRIVVWSHADSTGINTNLSYLDFRAARDAADLVYSIYDGTTWSTPAPVAATPGLDADLQLSRMSNGDLLAVWIYSDTNAVQHLVSSTWDGKSWDAVHEITSGYVNSPNAQQVGGITYLMWTAEVNTNHDHSLFTSKNSGPGWSAPALFSPATLQVAAQVVTAPAATVLPKTSLGDLLFPISEAEHKACCKCDNGIANTNANKNEGCGIASVDYNYETCHRIFTYKPCQVRPSDPNNIVGPDGYGTQRWVPASSPLDYTIQFENDPTLASAPATRVTITIPLDAHFDPRTFRLGDFGFGGLIFNIPAGSAFYQTRVDLTATKGYYVDLIAGVDIVNHQGFWTLTTIDPATGDVPLNALTGFLPPNHTPPEGEGFVSFSVTPSNGSTNGSPVAAQATIVFDNQPPMNTPTALNTLQSAQPHSSVLPLPAVTLTPTFAVAWQGSATNGGSGVTSYDIYASENGGIYYPWLQGTTLSQASFIGQPGGTYAFYSIAHDNVGNTQASPTNADTVTFVSSNLPPVILPVTNLVIAPDSTAVVRLHATDPNGDALTYSLTTAPTGATLTTNTGVFRWNPTRAFASTTNLVTVTVTDNGVPPLSTNATFSITVLDYLELTLGETNLPVGQTASISISVASSEGATNVLFAIKLPGNLLTNWALTAPAPQIGANTLQNFATNILVTLSTATGQLLQGTQQVSRLSFSAITNQVSGFITLPITQLSAVKPGGAGYANYLAHAGTVIVVQNEPLIRVNLGANQARTLQLYGQLGTGYQLLYATNLMAPVTWQTALTYTQTNGVINLPVDSSNPIIFYRLLAP